MTTDIGNTQAVLGVFEGDALRACQQTATELTALGPLRRNRHGVLREMDHYCTPMYEWKTPLGSYFSRSACRRSQLDLAYELTTWEGLAAMSASPT